MTATEVRHVAGHTVIDADDGCIGGHDGSALCARTPLASLPPLQPSVDVEVAPPGALPDDTVLVVDLAAVRAERIVKRGAAVKLDFGYRGEAS